MGRGDVFGEIALLDGAPRTATAAATAHSDLLQIKREPFLELLKKQPDLVIHLLRLLCQRIRWTSGLAEDSALLSVPARLARRLMNLVALHGKGTIKGVELKLSQEELGHFLGISRQIVNHYLQEWKAKKWLSLSRGKIVIKDPNALQNVS